MIGMVRTVADLRLREEEGCLLSVQPLPAPVGQPDTAAVQQVGDQVLAQPVLMHVVAGIGPMHGLAGLDGGFDLFKCHDPLLF